MTGIEFDKIKFIELSLAKKWAEHMSGFIYGIVIFTNFCCLGGFDQNSKLLKMGLNFKLY